MKVLVTGANGFVGSHILDALLDRGMACAILLREQADTEFIRARLAKVEVRHGSVTEPATLPAAVRGVTHVVHCAGRTKALHAAEFHQVNQGGTRNLLDALRAGSHRVERLVHLSSLAASHPATAECPAAEDDPPAPVTAYGRSKLAAEQEIVRASPVPYVILRPPAVYGPRDRDVLAVFRAVRLRLVPLVRGGRQPLSLAYVRDLADAVCAALCHPRAAGGVFHVAADEVVTARQVTAEIARQRGLSVVMPTMPRRLFWGLCAARDILSQLQGRPHILSRQKYAELTAPGWVCRVDRLRTELGFTCATRLAAGVERALGWYREAGWL